jgi:fatty-acyl-CoA synthase
VTRELSEHGSASPLGAMQRWPLTVDKILDHAKTWHGDREVVARSVEGPVVRTTYAEIHRRARRLSGALASLGVSEGDRVATLAWNTARHIEAWYATMGMGAICHTLNPRLSADQLRYIVNHASDKVLLFDATFIPLVALLREHLPTVEHYILMSDEAAASACGLAGVHSFEKLISSSAFDQPWGGFDEDAPCGLCYTSGTTGLPRGVLYSHRSNFLHTLTTLGRDVMALSSTDTVLPIVPMFHANAWGLAFSCPAVGAKLVLPGAKLDGASVHELLETEGVTFSAAVPTVWQMLLAHLREVKGSLSTLKRVVIGGAAVPEAMVRAFEDEFGVEVTHAWGMTELSPLGTLSSPTDAVARLPREQALPFRLKQGRAPLGVEMVLVDDTGDLVAHDGKKPGRLLVRGPWVVERYYREGEGNVLDQGGWFDTGDIATIDKFGYMQITDRAKDIVKSGGEWISSIEIENLALSHPAVANAAAVGVPHPKWDERPVLVVEPRPGMTVTPEDLRAHLDGRIARWWMPDEYILLDAIPLGATGKINKLALRDLLRARRGATEKP